MNVYRVVTNFSRGSKSSHDCVEHHFVNGHTLEEVRCIDCDNLFSITEDQRDKSPEWWKERRMESKPERIKFEVLQFCPQKQDEKHA